MNPTRSRRFSGLLDRRGLLRLGLLPTVGLGLPELLCAAPRSREKSCIFILLNGGLSHIDTIDPKPDAPEEIRGKYRPIPSRIPGVRFSEMLPKLAALSDRFCLLRTLTHQAADHLSAAHSTLSGQSDGSRANNTPYFGSAMAKIRPSPAGIPSYVWLHNLLVGTRKIGRNESGGVLGPAYAPFRIGNDLDTPAVLGFKVRAFEAPDGLSDDMLRQRFDLLERLEPAGVGTDMQRLQERALDLITRPEARQAFDLDREPVRVRERYGRHPMGQYFLMARRLIEAGTRLVSVVACPGMPPGYPDAPVRQLWDMHDEYYEGRDNIYGVGPYGLGMALPRLDQALSALIDDMIERGMLDDTLLVIATEFGRTPKFEGKGRGRGHWPYCYSMILAGAGVRGGTAYGSSDATGGYVKSGLPITPETLGATIFHALGVAPETRPDVRNLAYRVSDGEPLLDIFS